MLTPAVSERTAVERQRRRPRARRYLTASLSAAAAGLLVALLAFGVIAQSPSAQIDQSLAAGHPASAPAFTLAVLQRGSLGPELTARLAPALAAGRLGTRDLRGIPVVLNIWASWCDPCRQEAPLLERAWRAAGRPRGVLFLGLDMQDATTDAHAFLRQFHIDYLNVRDPSNDVPVRYGATGVPETFFIDRKGMIVGHVIGVTNPAQLRAGMAAALTGRVVGSRQGGARRRVG